MIRVTQSHIDSGCHDSEGCPVFLALEEAGEKPYSVLQTHTLMHGRRLQHGEALQSWILAYDIGAGVEPVTLKIENDRLDVCTE